MRHRLFRGVLAEHRGPAERPGTAPVSGGFSDAERLFDLRYDSGFARYTVPVLAHTAYLNDYAIYEQTIDQAMKLGTTRTGGTRVESRPDLAWNRLSGRFGCVLGVSANIGQNLSGVATMTAAKDDLRFFIGAQFDVGKLVAKLPY